MKRIICLSLIVMLCCGLIACGGNAAPTATEEILPPQETKNQIPQILFGAGESPHADHPYLQEVCGTWEFRENFASSEYTMYRKLTLREDGTCVIDGENGNWNIDDTQTREDRLYILLYQNSEVVSAATFQIDSKYGMVLWPVYKADGVEAQPNYMVLITKNVSA